MDLVYAAYTEACIFGLDDAGICRTVEPRPGASEASLAMAKKCLGAQYVASLDASVEGMLIPLPKPGTRLLFARAGEDGRIALVRSGPLFRFESCDDIDPVTTPELPIARDTERMADEDLMPTKGYDEDPTSPFARVRPAAGAPADHDVHAVVTRRAPTTNRGFPAPPAELPVRPGVRAYLRNPVVIA